MQHKLRRERFDLRQESQFDDDETCLDYNEPANDDDYVKDDCENDDIIKIVDTLENPVNFYRPTNRYYSRSLLLFFFRFFLLLLDCYDFFLYLDHFYSPRSYSARRDSSTRSNLSRFDFFR